MKLTSKSMEWLNQNRYRAYPASRDEWRSKVPAGSGLDRVLLDALVLDSDAKGGESLYLASVEIGQSSTVVLFRYGAKEFTVEISGGEISGEESYEHWRGAISGNNDRLVYVSLSLSSHAYILSEVGVTDGAISLNVPILPARVVGLTEGLGVDGIDTNGSAHVHQDPKRAVGDVVLEDGYRTSPIIHNGKVVVRVGKRYGIDPCKYPYGSAGSVNCEAPMFFFCGQNGVNSGNVVLSGGKGITVLQGKQYTVTLRGDAYDARRRRFRGRSIPCVEIIAGPELLDMYRPE